MAESDPGGASAPQPGESEAHLLLAPAGVPAVEAYCEDHLAAGPGAEVAPLVVLVGDREADPSPARSGVVVVVGDPTRGGGTLDADPARSAGPPSPPETVPVSEDLGTAGVTIDRYLTAWSSSGYRPAVCVDSVSGLLEVASIPATYRFLYVLRRRVETIGATVHAHVDPRAHEGEVLRTFYPLFDRVVSFRDGGASRP